MTSAAPTPAESFARLIGGLCRAVAAAAKNPLAAPLLLLLWPRLNRLARRFTALAARASAGTAAPGRRASPRPVAQRPHPPYQRLPRRFAWLLPVVPGAAAAGSQLQHLLGEPQTAALLAAAPQAGRLVRPLCRMLGVRPPPVLTPSQRPARSPAAPKRPAAGPSPAVPPSGPGRRHSFSRACATAPPAPPRQSESRRRGDGGRARAPDPPACWRRDQARGAGRCAGAPSLFGPAAKAEAGQSSASAMRVAVYCRP